MSTPPPVRGDGNADGGRTHRRLRVVRPVLVAAALIACALLAGGLVVRQVLLASLAQTDGSQTLPGLTASVRVDRDALGVPTVRGANRLDVARATGFVHAQERFFQMDLTRRMAAGELSELVGPDAISTDKANRIHRLRAVAREVLARALPGERALLRAYADGVNAGLSALGARPPEYLLLRSQPEPWRPEDSVLVIGAMFANDLANARREPDLGLMYDLLPAPLVDFLRPLGDQWDSPLLGGTTPPPSMPDPKTFMLRGSRPTDVNRPPTVGEAWRPSGLAGSNAWAIAGSHTADGRTLLANDPHLPLNVPNIWYRISLEWADARGTRHRVTGASLPGLPYVAIGSNGHIAWGFTVAFDDRSDMVVVEKDPAGRDLYRTPEGPRRFDHVAELIKVKGGNDVRIEVLSTIWGPVFGTDGHRRPLALQWQAHHPDAVNLELGQMETATTVEQALDIANRSGLPSYNIVVADDRGSIGWTVVGRLPYRAGFDGRVPSSWADGTHRWDGWLEPGEYPRVVNPPSGRIWSANNRPVDRPLLDRLGLEGYIMGPRARQVHDDLMALPRSTPRDSLRIQLDDRALFLERWRRFFLDQLRGDARRRQFRRLLEESWDGRASAQSVGYLLVHDFRFELARLVIGRLIEPCLIADPNFDFRPNSLIEWWESALWRLVHERPRHLLDPGWNTWDDVIAAAVDRTIATATADGRALTSATWGSTTGRISHPLSQAAAWLAPWLDMPLQPLPGDVNMPRVRMPSPAGEVSASLRMVVSPGHEETGIFHMPGGESGHPLSPHYRDMQESWVEGQATPFLPGPAVHTLALEPGKQR